jgi:Ca2+-binding EF-hand superfamily protein
MTDSPSSQSGTRPISSISAKSDVNLTATTPNPQADVLRKQWIEGFRLFESKPKDFIPSKDLGMLLRTQLKNPSELQVAQYLKEIDPDNNGFVSLEAYLKLMANPEVPDPETQSAVLEAFEVFDPDQKGTMSATELRNVLTNIGDKDLTDEEISELIRTFADNDNGTASYANFIKTCFSNMDIHKKKEKAKGGKKSPKKK